MPDVDGVEVFAIGGPLHKELVVEVVAVVAHKDMDVAHDLQHVQSLQGKSSSPWQQQGH